MQLARIPNWVTRHFERISPGSWWAGRSRLGQVGYVGAGAWLSLYALSRMFHGATARRKFMGYPPPGHFKDAYHRIDHDRNKYTHPISGEPQSDFYSPISRESAIQRGGDQIAQSHTNLNLRPTGGLVQAQHSRRSGHTMMGATKSRDQLSRLFNIQ